MNSQNNFSKENLLSLTLILKTNNQMISKFGDYSTGNCIDIKNCINESTIHTKSARKEISGPQ